MRRGLWRTSAVLLTAGLAAACTTPTPPFPAPPPVMTPSPSPPVPPPPLASALLGAAPYSAFPVPAESRERYSPLGTNPVKATSEDRFSTFSVDVDTGSYANVRRFLTQGTRPPDEAVRVEEMINYFRYDLPAPPDRSQPFSVTTDLAVTPWNPETLLLRVALRGYDVARTERPPANLVFLVDVSGSMEAANKLPMVKATLTMLAEQLRADDRVSVVTYSDTAELVLEPTNDREALRAAIAPLKAAGFTAGARALDLAYFTARRAFIEGGINRVILATDGDFNLGPSDPESLKRGVESARVGGVTLTTLGFGEGDYSEAMMETLADAGNGNYAYIDSLSEARKVLVEELSSTLFTIAQDVKAQLEFNPAQVAEWRLIGYENRQLAREDFGDDKVDAGDIGAGHQVTALYELAMAGSKDRRLPEGRYGAPAAPGAGAAPELGFLELRYKTPGAETSTLVRQPIAAPVAPVASPRGDFAFAASVAAFGQALRGGKYLGGFSRDDIVRLAGPQTDFHRQEFLRLVALSGASGGR